MRFRLGSKRKAFWPVACLKAQGLLAGRLFKSARPFGRSLVQERKAFWPVAFLIAQGPLFLDGIHLVGDHRTGTGPI